MSENNSEAYKVDSLKRSRKPLANRTLDSYSKTRSKKLRLSYSDPVVKALSEKFIEIIESGFNNSLFNLGYREVIVLAVAASHEKFTPADCIELAKQIGLVIEDRKAESRRFWDAIQRLIRRGFIRKLGYGVYELSKDLSVEDLRIVLAAKLACKKLKELHSHFGFAGGGAGVLLELFVFDGRVRDMLRVHDKSAYTSFVRHLCNVGFSHGVLEAYSDVLIAYADRLGFSKSFARNLLSVSKKLGLRGSFHALPWETGK